MFFQLDYEGMDSCTARYKGGHTGKRLQGWVIGLQKIFGQGVLRKGRFGLLQDCRVGGTLGDKGGGRRITRTLNVTVQSLDLIQ